MSGMEHALRSDIEAIRVTAENISEIVRGLPLKAKIALRAALHLPKGSLTVHLPDRRVLRIDGKAAGPDAVLLLRNWELVRRSLTGGTIAVGETYMAGDWDSPDITTFLEFFLVNEQLGVALASPSRLFSWISGVRHWFNRNTRSGSRRNIAAHYDLGNAFYERWLDPSMTYSSALYADGANSLERAQDAKYQALIDATGITADDHVLEIGCGWGGFAEYAARTTGCRVTGLTISREQLDYARRRIAAAGLSDRVSLRFQDYRDVEGTYDKIVSIEMFEAVGEQYWSGYFDTLRDRLRPGGSAGLQIITINERAYPSYRTNPDFIQRYIFPGGMLPTPKILDELAGASGLGEISRRVFPLDYAKTLAEWRERFADAWASIAPLGFDERFRRMWNFYFHYCEAGFRSEFIDVRQLVYRRA